MYSGDEDIWQDIVLVKRCLMYAMQCRFKQAMNLLGNQLWPRYDKLASHSNLEAETPRFYLIFGYGSLTVLRAVASLRIRDIRIAKHYVEQAKYSAYQ